jgi:hypothetical protein
LLDAIFLFFSSTKEIAMKFGAYKINRFAVKCKLCKKRWMTTVERQQAFTAHESECPRYTEIYNRRLATYREPQRFLDAERWQMSQVFCEYLQVNGSVNNTVKCDARCEGATRHICECSCGGENHGIGKVA